MTLTLRMVFYTIATLVMAAGFGSMNYETGILTLDLNQIAAALGSAGALNGIVLWLWGKK